MLSIETYRNCEKNDYDHSFYMIAVGYDPEMKSAKCKINNGKS